MRSVLVLIITALSKFQYICSTHGLIIIYILHQKSGVKLGCYIGNRKHEHAYGVSLLNFGDRNLCFPSYAVCYICILLDIFKTFILISIIETCKQFKLDTLKIIGGLLLLSP